MLNKELEAQKIIAKENALITRYIKHRNGDTPTAYQHKGYVSEDAMCSDFFTWAFNSYPQLRGYLFHIANEGDTGDKAGIIKGAIRKAKGVTAGVPDYCCTYNPEVIWPEAKLPGETLSPKQILLHEKWKEKGHKIVVFENFFSWRIIIESLILKMY